MTKLYAYILTATATLALSAPDASAGGSDRPADQPRIISGTRTEFMSHTARDMARLMRKPSKQISAKSPHKTPLALRSRVEASDVIYSCSFDFMTEGSETAPVAFELDDWDCIPEEIIGEENYGFGGQGIMQAGGAVYVPFEYNDDPESDEPWYVYGMIWTPDFYEAMNVTVEMDAKIAPGSDFDSDKIWASVSDYSDIVDEDGTQVSKQWQHITLSLNASSFSPESDDDSFYITIWPEIGADLIIKNVVIKGESAPLAVPVASDYTGFTGASFTANWNAVADATGYYLTVYEYDPLTNKTTSTFLDNQPVQDTHYDVTGITPGKFYAYDVTATNGTYTTPASNIIRVCELMQPTGVIVAPSSDNSSITAKWDATPGANYYVLTGSCTHNVTAGQKINLANADFSSIESSGTVTEPLESEYWYDNRPELPGWQFSLGCSADGAYGFMDNAQYTAQVGLYASLTSLDHDLSNIKDGKVTVDVEAASPGNGMLAGLLTLNETENKYEVASAYGTQSNVPQEYTKYSFDLTGATAHTQFIFTTRTENNADGTLLIRKLEITAEAKADGTIGIPLGTVQTAETEGTFNKAPEDGVTYTVTVAPYLVDNTGYIVAVGQPSAPVSYKGETGAVNSPVVGSDDTPAIYYNLQGIRVANPEKGSIVIKVTNSKATKVIF